MSLVKHCNLTNLIAIINVIGPLYCDKQRLCPIIFQALCLPLPNPFQGLFTGLTRDKCNGFLERFIWHAWFTCWFTAYWVHLVSSLKWDAVQKQHDYCLCVPLLLSHHKGQCIMYAEIRFPFHTPDALTHTVGTLVLTFTKHPSLTRPLLSTGRARGNFVTSTTKCCDDCQLELSLLLLQNFRALTVRETQLWAQKIKHNGKNNSELKEVGKKKNCVKCHQKHPQSQKVRWIPKF